MVVQKTAAEMNYGLSLPHRKMEDWRWTCPFYTSDAADDPLCVDLGGRRIITKQKYHSNTR